MRNVRGHAVLVLNSSFEPVSIASLRRAIVLVVKDTALVQEDLGREIHAGIMWPSVIRLKEYRRVPHRTQKLSRRNILLRDGHRCQYCEEKLPAAVLTLDHVVPRSKGGPSTWENLVACCKTCNRRKANLSVEEAGMKLLRRPRPVTLHTARGLIRTEGEAEQPWQKYLYYDNGGSKSHVMQG